MGLKKLKPHLLRVLMFRLRAGARIGGTFFLVAMGLFGTALTAISATGTIVPPKIAVGFLLLVIIGSIVAAIIKGRAELIPPTFVDELGADGQYTAKYCDANLLSDACYLTQPYYRQEYVPDYIAEQWRLRNPKAFVAVLNSKGVMCSCFGILALADAFWDGFLRGRLNDTQLQANDILPPESVRSAENLYLSGVVVRDPHTYCGAKRARVMLWVMLIYLKQIYGLKKSRTLYALAVNDDSRRLLTDLDFSLFSDSRQRLDRCDLFSYTLTNASWHDLLARVGDLSTMCKCDFRST